MSDDEKKPSPRKQGPRAAARDPNAPNNCRPGEKSLSPRLWIAARAMYEGDLKITYRQVAKEFGVSLTTLERRARDERWLKNVNTIAGMTEKAHKLADSAGTKLLEAGPELSAEKTDEVRKAVTEEAGVDARADVLSRHRMEWAAPRKLSYEAIQNRDFDRAKLAKITAETLQLIQAGERKAWGLDKGDTEPGTTVVIERG